MTVLLGSQTSMIHHYYYFTESKVLAMHWADGSVTTWVNVSSFLASAVAASECPITLLRHHKVESISNREGE